MSKANFWSSLLCLLFLHPAFILACLRGQRLFSKPHAPQPPFTPSYFIIRGAGLYNKNKFLTYPPPTIHVKICIFFMVSLIILQHMWLAQNHMVASTWALTCGKWVEPSEWPDSAVTDERSCLHTCHPSPLQPSPYLFYLFMQVFDFFILPLGWMDHTLLYMCKPRVRHLFLSSPLPFVYQPASLSIYLSAPCCVFGS